MFVVLMGSARAKRVENSPVNATKDSLAPTVMRVRAKKENVFYCPPVLLEKDSILPSQTSLRFLHCNSVILGIAVSFHIPLG